MRILVTGATGFIGSQLARLLVRRGEAVRVLCRPGADLKPFDDLNLEICPGDILDAARVERAMAGCDRVFHLAAYARNWAKDPNTFFTVNVGGLKNVLDTALKTRVKKVVFTSSAVTLGPSNGCAVSESAVRVPEFFTDYERSKFVAEESIRHYLQRGLAVVIVNPTRVFGPGLLCEANAITKMIQLYLQGKWRLVLGNGSEIGNYAFVNDVVAGHLLAMSHGKAGERYILGGENVSFNNLFNIIADLCGQSYRLFHVPSALALAFSKIEQRRAQWLGHYPLITPDWVRTFLADWACSCAKAKRELGYAITPLRQALATTITWLKARNEKASR
jgi:farnesol dehydrogenase